MELVAEILGVSSTSDAHVISPVESQLIDMQLQLGQINVVLMARKEMKRIYTSIEKLDKMVQGQIISGSFDQIPTETKQAMNRIYQMYLTFKAALESDADFDILVNF